jgi:hypothetical protein
MIFPLKTPSRQDFDSGLHEHLVWRALIHKHGALAEETWGAMDRSFGAIAGSPGGRRFIESNKSIFDPEFVALASSKPHSVVSGYGFSASPSD